MIQIITLAVFVAAASAFPTVQVRPAPVQPVQTFAAPETRPQPQPLPVQPDADQFPGQQPQFPNQQQQQPQFPNQQQSQFPNQQQSQFPNQQQSQFPNQQQSQFPNQQQSQFPNQRPQPQFPQQQPQFPARNSYDTVPVEQAPTLEEAPEEAVVAPVEQTPDDDEPLPPGPVPLTESEEERAQALAEGDDDEPEEGTAPAEQQPQEGEEEETNTEAQTEGDDDEPEGVKVLEDNDVLYQIGQQQLKYFNPENKDAIKKIIETPETIEWITKIHDEDKDGKISTTEWESMHEFLSNYWEEALNEPEIPVILKEWNTVDTKDDKVIDVVGELYPALFNLMTEPLFKTLVSAHFQAFDENKDGKLNKQAEPGFQSEWDAYQSHPVTVEFAKLPTATPAQMQEMIDTIAKEQGGEAAEKVLKEMESLGELAVPKESQE